MVAVQIGEFNAFKAQQEKVIADLQQLVKQLTTKYTALEKRIVELESKSSTNQLVNNELSQALDNNDSWSKVIRKMSRW